MPDSYDLTTLRQRIKPWRLHWCARVKSTSDRAATLRKRGELFAPAVVLTGCQTSGRGRGSNRWWSGRGCITATFVLPVDEQLAAHQLPLAAGLAVRQAAVELTGCEQIQLKWPNDLQHEGRKLAGLLCERMGNADLVGIGLNVNVRPAAIPRELRARITALSQICFREIDITHALAVVASSLEQTLRRLHERPVAAMIEEYNAHHVLMGRRVAIRVPNESEPVAGTVAGLDDAGRLLLRDGDAIHRISSGTVEMT